MEAVQHQTPAGGNRGNRRDFLVAEQNFDGNGRNVHDGPVFFGIVLAALGFFLEDFPSVLVQLDGPEGVVPALESLRESLGQDHRQTIVEYPDPPGQVGVPAQRHFVNVFLDGSHDGLEFLGLVVDHPELGNGVVDLVALDEEFLDAFLQLGNGVREAGDPLGELLGSRVPADAALLGDSLGGVELDLESLRDDFADIQQLRQDQGFQRGRDEAADGLVGSQCRLDGNRKGVPLLGFVAGPQHGPGDLLVESEPLELPDFLGECLGFFGKVDRRHQLVGADVSLHDNRVRVEPGAGLDGEFLFPCGDPVPEKGPGVELGQEFVSRFAELPSLQLGSPVGSQDLRAALHEGVDLSLHLLGPQNLSRDRRDAPELGDAGGRGRLVLEDELGLELLDGPGDGGNELHLEFLDGDPDAGPGQEGVEPGKDPEHVLGVDAGRELVPEELGESFLHGVHAQVVFLQGRFECLGPAGGEIENVQRREQEAGSVFDRLNGAGRLVGDAAVSTGAGVTVRTSRGQAGGRCVQVV
mmetsp:Transcript_17313/g.47709  ORF Transcript_17313/g.47709 Transcript_17313/m.47709 type:complete len:525 (+) Transcript_17313:2791-4365(+)